MIVSEGRSARPMPREFAFVPIGAGGTERAIRNDANALEHRAFAQEFANTIKRMDLQDVVALPIVPRADFDGESETTMEDKNTLYLSGEHRVASPDHPSDGKHNVRPCSSSLPNLIVLS